MKKQDFRRGRKISKKAYGNGNVRFFVFSKKNSVESNAKNHIIFSEKIGEKSDKKMVKKKLKKTRSKKWSKLVQKEKNARLKKPSAILTKKLKALVLLEFGK